jgi:DNA-binding CsgD family transcriptional regulator
MASFPRVIDILSAAHTLADRHQLRTHILRQFRDASGGDGAVFVDATSLLCFDHDRAVCERFYAHPERYQFEAQAIGEASRRGRPFVDAQLFADRSRLPLYADLGVRSLLNCPLTFRGRAVGHIVIINDRGDFDPAVMPHIEELATATALTEAAVQSSDHDPADKAMRAAFAALSERERQIAQLLAAGLQNKEIAQVFGTSPNTIRKQTVSIFAKLGVRGRIDVARWMQRLAFACDNLPHGPSGSLKTRFGVK